MSDTPPVRTALFEEHVALNANLVDFHGFELPIWYSNIKDEHLATPGAGLFDVSHMGSFRFQERTLGVGWNPSQLSGSPPSSRQGVPTRIFSTRMDSSLTT